MVTVENSEDVSAFANFSRDVTSIVAPESSRQSDGNFPVTSTPKTLSRRSEDKNFERVLASPLARRLAREAEVSLSDISPLNISTGPHGRLLGADIVGVIASGTHKNAVATDVASPPTPPSKMPSNIQSGLLSGESALATASLMRNVSSQSKKTVPHYYLSVEINLSNILSLQKSLADDNVSVQSVLIKAAAKAMEEVSKIISSVQKCNCKSSTMLGSGSKCHLDGLVCAAI